MIKIAVLLVFATITQALPNFQAARTAIQNAGPNINYNSFCSIIGRGEDKIACRIASVPSVGFLVCQRAFFEEDGEFFPCNGVVQNELTNLMLVAQGGVRTVRVDPNRIDGVRCGDEDSTTCSGFLEEWVTNAQFQQIRDHISNNTVLQLIAEVKAFVPSARWGAVAVDLTNIKTFMRLNPCNDMYRQICDLQGFFLQSGGFIVADVPSVEELGLDGVCFAGEPTTAQVLAALNTMIEAFSLPPSRTRYIAKRKKFARKWHFQSFKNQ